MKCPECESETTVTAGIAKCNRCSWWIEQPARRLANTETIILENIIMEALRAARNGGVSNLEWARIAAAIDGLKESVAATTRMQVSLEYDRKLAEVPEDA